MRNSTHYPDPKSIEIDRLEFDFQNPRLPVSLQRSLDDPRKILHWMLNDAGVIDLMRSIGAQGYFDGEPLLVISSESDIEHFVVVEGNRRLAALKLLNSPNLASGHPLLSRVEAAANEAKYRPDRVASIVYEKREDILAYLGYRHITGIKSWTALAKARYLNELAQHYADFQPSERHRILARNIGSNSSYVAKLLAGLRLYEVMEESNFFGIKDLSEDDVDFSLITTALGYRNIQDFLGLESAQDIDQLHLEREHLENFTSWLFDKDRVTRRSRLEDSRNLGKLNAIVGSKDALSYFQKGFSIHEAALLTDEPVQNFRNLIGDIRQKLQAAQDTLNQVREYSQTDLDNLDDLFTLVRNIRAVVRDYLDTDAT